MDAPNPRTFVGTGKADEIAELARSREADLVIFDDELTPSQLSLIHIYPNNVRRVVRAFELLEEGASYAEQKQRLATVAPFVPAVQFGLAVEPAIPVSYTHLDGRRARQAGGHGVDRLRHGQKDPCSMPSFRRRPRGRAPADGADRPAHDGRGARELLTAPRFWRERTGALRRECDSGTVGARTQMRHSRVIAAVA